GSNPAPATNNINALAEKSAKAFLRLEALWKHVSGACIRQVVKLSLVSTVEVDNYLIYNHLFST
ncbi:hypothetical protein, partial [Thalassospira profundimaris]|uniref:hypothetical protein n=1 Tax=Thalassospira profundimaris TaxID=502049 RepID=UPI001C68ED80